MTKFEKLDISMSENPAPLPRVQISQFYENKKLLSLIVAGFFLELVVIFFIYKFYFGLATESNDARLRTTGYSGYFKNTSIDYTTYSSTVGGHRIKIKDDGNEYEDDRTEDSDESIRTSGVDETMKGNGTKSSEGGNSHEASGSFSYEASSEFELPKLQKCGRRKIENGNFTEDSEVNTYFGEYPWMLSLLYYNSRGTQIYKCGASLITPDIVLTAAHCVQFDVEYLVRSGDWFITGNLDDEYLPFESRDVANVTLHPQYSADTLENDIALLKLASKLEYADHIQPICLMDWFVKIDPNRCILTGWGKDGPADPTNNKFLRRIGLSLVEREACEAELRLTKLNQYFTLPYGSLCAWNTSSPVNSCKGDGGSPLICPTVADPNQYVQVGIAIWSVDCDPAVPDIFTNVEAYREWIDEVVMEFGNITLIPSD